MTEKMASNKGTSWETTGALGITDMYKHFKDSTHSDLTKKQYKQIVESCNKKVMDLVINKGKRVRLPYLSYIFITKSRTSGRTNIDYNHFNKTGEKKEFSNKHSDGFRGRLHWAKRLCRVSGKTPYSLKLSRDNARSITKVMNEFNGHAIYAEIQ